MIIVNMILDKYNEFKVMYGNDGIAAIAFALMIIVPMGLAALPQKRRR